MTDVVWLSYHQPEVIARGYWDQGLLEDIFKQGNYEHHDGFAAFANNVKRDNPKGEVPGAIVIINGRTHVEDADKINADIAALPWVVFIDTGDEEASFHWREVKHPLMRVWVMMPRMNEHNDAHYKLPNGYRPTTRAVLKSIGYQEKRFDWVFIGQVNHDRRKQCVEAAKDLSNGYLITTDKFGDEAGGEPYGNYLAAMANSKIALCPSGIESPDNFRLYEALEAGCLPIVDAFSTKHQAPGFWQYLLGEDIPFPIVDYWDKLPELLPQLLRDWPENANRAFAWWQLKKREIKLRLEDDVRELRT